MKDLYFYNAKPNDLMFCNQLCLASTDATNLKDARKLWGKEAPIVRCRGEYYKMAHDDFKILSGRFPGNEYGEPEY